MDNRRNEKSTFVCACTLRCQYDLAHVGVILHPDVRIACSVELEGLIDARSPSDYSAGQIPGSVNVFWDATLDENRVLKKPDDLKKIYAEVGVTPDKKVILFTRGGVQLTHSYTVLSLLGFKNVDFFTGNFEGWENGALKKGRVLFRTHTNEPVAQQSTSSLLPKHALLAGLNLPVSTRRRRLIVRHLYSIL